MVSGQRWGARGFLAQVKRDVLRVGQGDTSIGRQAVLLAETIVDPEFSATAKVQAHKLLAELLRELGTDAPAADPVADIAAGRS